jgi:MFS family permease
MESVWYYVTNGAQTGPVSLTELKTAAATGRLAPADLVWQEGTADWVPARTVAGLFPAAPPPMPAAPPPPTYGLSPPPPPSAVPMPLPAAEPLSLDDDRKPRRRDRDPSLPPPGPPVWVLLAQVFLRRTFNPDPSKAVPEPAEEAALTRAGVMDVTARKFAVWRRAMLFVAALPCAFAALFGLIDVIAMDKEEKEPFSGFGMFLLYIQAFALFALPVAAVFGALAYDRLAASWRWVLIGGVVSLAVPLGVAFVPSDWIIDLKTSGSTTLQEERQAKGLVAAVVGISFYMMLVPAVLSLLPAVARACIRMKLLLPQSLVPGWGLVVSAPLCVLLTLATFVLVYHVAGNVLLLLGLLLWIGGPLIYFTRFNLLTRPVTAPADQEALIRTSLVVFGTIGVGMLLLVIYLFTGKVAFTGKALVGFDESTSLVRPWSLDLIRRVLEYLGRSLFLSVFFSDLVVRIALSVWREERAFAGTADAAGFDRTMAGLGSAVLPRGTAPPPAA